MAKKPGKSDDQEGDEINEGGGEGEEQNADRLPWLSGERGIFEPDGIFRVDDLVHRLGMTPRKARAFIREHVQFCQFSKSEMLFPGWAFNAAIIRLLGPDPGNT